MAVSVKLILRQQKRKSDGTMPLWIRVTVRRKSRFLATGIAVEPKYWNPDKQRIRTTHPLASAYNARLEDLILDARKIALDNPSTEAVKAALKDTRGSLTDYWQAHIENLDAQGKFWEWKKYRVTLSKVEAVFGTTIDFKDVDRSGLIRFERYLREQLHNRANTILKDLQRLRRIFRQAIKDNLLKAGDDPFLSYDPPRSYKPERRKLSFEEIGLLLSLDLPFPSVLRRTRDAFCFAFFAGGMRFSDVASLRCDSLTGEGRIEYRMLKTQTLVSLPIPPVALDLLAPYRSAGKPFVFPFLMPGDDAHPVQLRRRISSANVVANKYLKVLARLAGIDRPETVSFHVARHSYADFARRKSGNLYAISRTLGHADLKITQTYLKSLDQEAVDQLAEQLWT